MTKKDYTLAAFILLLIAILYVMSGCSANYYLRHAQKDLRRAQIKGATIDRDTTFMNFHFKSPEIKFETTLRPINVKDTIIMRDPKTGATVKAKIALKAGCPEDCIDTLYLQGNIPPQDVEARVPVKVDTTIKAGHGFWTDVKIALIAGVIGFIAGAIFWPRVRARIPFY